MTTISFADVPSDINSIERMLVWSGLALATTNPKVAILEAVDRYEAAAQALYFQAADQSQRVLIRACLPVDPAFAYDRTKKLWMHTQDLGVVQLPAAMKVN